MGQTTGAPPKPANPDPGDDDPWGDPNPLADGEQGNAGKSTELEYDPVLKKYFDPYTGEYVKTPGHYEPPPPPPRPVRVKVRKKGVRLRKRRKPVLEPVTPTPEPPPKPPVQYDEWGYPIEPEYDQYGNLVEYDEHGNEIEYDEYGQPVTPQYQYDEYGNPLPYNPVPLPAPKKETKPKYRIADDGYDYDDETYTYTTIKSTPPRTPSVESSDAVQEGNDSGDEMSMEDVTDFTWQPYVPVMPKEEARALLKTGGEFCRCFPHRSHPGIPSMVYDQVTCPHNTNVLGHAHGSVYRFDDNLDDKYTHVHRPRRPNRYRSVVTQVWGYPDLSFPEQAQGGAMFQGGLRGEFQKPSTTQQSKSGSKAGNSARSGRQSHKSQQSHAPSQRGGSQLAIEEGSQAGNKPEDEKPSSKAKDADGADDGGGKNGAASAGGDADAAPKLSREKMDQKSLSKKEERPARAQASRASIVEKRFLPRIGYTPENPFGESRGGTGGLNAGDDEGEEKQSQIPALPPIPASPATNKTYTYDIRPHFGRRVDQWSAVRN